MTFSCFFHNNKKKLNIVDQEINDHSIKATVNKSFYELYNPCFFQNIRKKPSYSRVKKSLKTICNGDHDRKLLSYCVALKAVFSGKNSQ